MKPAGWGTDHVGSGRCKFHGGAAGSGAQKGNQNARTHGLYSRIYADDQLQEAMELQGSVKYELAIARLQMANLLDRMQRHGERLILSRVEESVVVFAKTDSQIVADTKKRRAEEAERLGEYYDPDDDDLPPTDDDEGEKEVVQRKKVFERTSLMDEFIRLANLIIRLESLDVEVRKKRAEIRNLEGDTTPEEEKQYDSLSDAELHQEFSRTVEGFPKFIPISTDKKPES